MSYNNQFAQCLKSIKIMFYLKLIKVSASEGKHESVTSL